MKKVLLVVPMSTIAFGSKNAGGVDSVCQMLVEQLASVGSTEFFYRVVAFDPFNSGNAEITPVKLSDNVECVFFPAKEKVFGLPVPGLVSCNIRVKQQVAEFKPDIIHSHIGAWILGGVKVNRRITTLHAYTTVGRNPQSLLNDLVYERLIPKLIDKVVTDYSVVGRLLQEALKRDSEKHIQIVANPIASAFFSIQHEPNAGQRLRFVTCALLTSRKRIDVSIRLLKQVRRLGIDAELVIIGPSTDQVYVGELKALVDSECLTEFVQFAGACSRSEILKYYQSAQLGLFFSIEETFGLAPLEMIAAGLPVITSKVGVLAERYDEFSKLPSVLVSDKLDLDLLAARVNEIVSADTAAAKNFISSEYSVSRVVDCYECLYRRT